MQHHHSHIPHPQHMTNAHAMHQQATVVPAPPHIAINLGPPPPQQQQQQPPQQQQQQQSHHISSVGNGPAIQQQQPANIQQPPSHHHHHQQQSQQQQPLAQKSNYLPTVPNRLNTHHLRQQSQQNHLMQQRGNPQATHTTQMQKIRQQHQSVNNNNNKTSANSNNQPSPQPHPQQQQQQQHQQIQTQHQRHAYHPSAQNQVPHVKQHHLQQPQDQQQHQQLQTLLPPNTVDLKQQQDQQSYTGGNKIKYNTNINHHTNSSTNNNNNNNTNSKNSDSDFMPKTNLQKPNRSNSNSKQRNVILITPSEMTNNVANGSPAGANNSFNSTSATTTLSTATTAISNTPIVSAKFATSTTTILPPRNSKELKESSKIESAHSCENNENCAPSTVDDCGNMTSEEDGTISNTELTSNTGSSSKQKTPMCLVNELARFNKITHQYRLTSEKGPAHCKRFTVTLKLGDEEYSAEGFKIKRAQHMAAAVALEKTKYQHPVPKITRRSEEGSTSRSTITPTVELNALAMKLGQPTYYLFDPRQQPRPDPALPPPAGPDMMYGLPRPLGGPHMNPSLKPPLPPQPQHLLEGNPYMRRQPGQYQRFNYYRAPSPYIHQNKFLRYPIIAPVVGHNGAPRAMPPPPHHQQHPRNGFRPPQPPPFTPCKITLIVGKQKFVGTGRTLQAAKHDAASHALQVIRTQAADQLNEVMNRSTEDSDSKSPISLVHEIGIKRNMTVQFKILREEGPAHMKNFITACIVGNIMTEGCGNGKKISKKRAAENMLEELKKLPPLSPMKSPVKRIKMKAPTTRMTGRVSGSSSLERKKRAGGEAASSTSEKTEGDNNDESATSPISKLIQVLQASKESCPVYELISKNFNETTRRREYIMEVRAAGNVARGRGNNIKMAKTNAAQNLLDILNIEKFIHEEVINHEAAETTSTVPVEKESATVTDSDTTNLIDTTRRLSLSSKAATTIDYSPTNGRVPGILILRQHKKSNSSKNSPKHAAIVVPSSSMTTTTTTPSVTAQSEATQIQTPKNKNNLVSLSSASTTLMSALTKTGGAVGTETSTTLKSIAEPQEAMNSATNTSKTCQATSALASSTIEGNKSKKNDTIDSTTATSSSSSGLRMKKQLLYLAQVLGFEVEFSDYPKGNHNEYLTIVTLSTTPEQICHGTGINSEESQNDAARNALKILSELDMDRVKSK